ncbi:MAG: hypothetical protein J6I84_03940 [Bacilli bacterium]|nr:hypothetical protein [Bacilli bacterium]
MSEQKKIKRIKAEGENGKSFYFKFKPLFNVAQDELICETRCPYSQICDNIRDPRALSDPERAFSDFCGELGETENPEILNMIPCDGSLEEGFKDEKDIFEQLIKENPTIRLNDMIEKVCSTGWCDDYSEDHVNCKACNQSCLMRDLFIKVGTEGEGE